MLDQAGYEPFRSKMSCDHKLIRLVFSMSCRSTLRSLAQDEFQKEFKYWQRKRPALKGKYPSFGQTCHKLGQIHSSMVTIKDFLSCCLYKAKAKVKNQLLCKVVANFVTIIDIIDI